MVKSVYVPRAGGIIDFPDSATPEQMLAYIDSNYGAPEPEAPSPQEEVGALESGVYGSLGKLGVTGGSVAQAAGLDWLSKYLFDQAKRNQEYASRYKPDVADVSEIRGIGDLASFAGSTIAQSAPETAVNLSGVYAGSTAGAAIGSAFAGIGAVPGALIGGAIGGAISALPFFIGGNLQRQAAEKNIPIEETDLYKASAGAALQAPADTAFELLIARKFPIGGTALNIARKGFFKEVIKTAAEGAITEGITEPVQQAIEIAQADPEKLAQFSPKIQFEILNAAAAGALSGGVIGGAAGGIDSTIKKSIEERPYRQLQSDLAKESGVNYEAARQGRIAQAAENLRQHNVNGPIDINEEDVDGDTAFTIRGGEGNILATFKDRADAVEAVNRYAQDTAADVSVREPLALPEVFPTKVAGKSYNSMDEVYAARNTLNDTRNRLIETSNDADLIKSKADEKGVSPDFYRGLILNQIERHDVEIKKYDDFIDSAEGVSSAPPPEDTSETTPEEETPEPITDYTDAVSEEAETPVGVYEPPVDEQRYIEEAPVVDDNGAVDVPEVSTELRSPATAEQLSDLQTEMFGEPINIRQITPEQRTAYEAERDSRYPPVPTPVYSASPTRGTMGFEAEAAPTPERGPGEPAADVIEPKSMREAAMMGPRVRAYTPEVRARFSKIYNELASDLESIAPPETVLRLREFIDDAGPDTLVRGSYTHGDPKLATKNVIDLATGIWDPRLTVDQLIAKMREVLNHEVIHALRANGLIRASEWNMLSRAAVETKMPGKSYTYLDKAQAIYTPEMDPVYANPDAVIEEAVAEMYKDWASNLNKPVKQTSPSRIWGLFNRITAFFKKIFNALKRNSYEDLFKSIKSGEVKARTPGQVDTTGTRFSAEPITPTLTAGVQGADGNVEVRPFPEVNEGSSSVYLRRDFKKTKTAGRVRDRAWGAALDRAFLNRIGRQLDINNPQDYEHIVMSISDEIKHQMKQAQSGVGWYDSDIQDVFDELSKSFPVLKDPAEGPVYRQIFTLIAGVMSNGMKAKANVELAAINFAHFLRTGQFSSVNPFTNKGWNQRSNIMGPQIAMLNSMVSDPMFNPRYGSNNPELERYENFLRFMFSEHSVREINQFRSRHGTRSPAKIGRLDDRRLGMYAFGPKFGPFILNLNGMSDETVDSWASRSFYRHMGKSVGPDGELIQAPLGKDREAMKRALRDVGAATNLSSRDIQAVLWFYEKELFNQLGQKIPLEVFSDGAKEFTRKYGTGSTGSPESRTDREREISGAVEAAGARYSPPLERSEGGRRFSAAPALNSEEFRKWFKNSKIVDENGKPLVVFHGTSDIFDEFKQDTGGKKDRGWLGRGFYFTNSTSLAKMYAMIKPGPKERVIPVYLSMQNPYYATLQEKEFLKAAEQSGNFSAAQEFTDKLVAAGHDGVILDYKTADKVKEYMILDAVQVKSVDNKFEPGTATSRKLSAAPLPPYIEQKNRTLFRPEPNVPFHKSMFEFFFGQAPSSRTLNTVYGNIDVSKRTRLAVSARAAMVDRDAAIEFLEKTANEKDTGNFERRTADYSAVAALAWARRSSQIAASVIMMGKPKINYARAGDIQSATISAEEDPDSLMNIFKILLQPGPVDSTTNKQKDKREVFKSYAVAIRSRNKAAAGKTTPGDADATYINTVIPFTQQNYPEVVQAYEMYQRYNKNLLTAAKDAGVISAQEFARLTRDMDYYGFNREVYEEELFPNIPTKVGAQFKLREYKGSKYGNLIDDPMFVIVQNTQFWMNAIARNVATTKAFKLAQDMGEARMLGASEKPDLSRGESDQVLFFRESGVPRRFAVRDPLLLDALGSDDRADIGKAMKLMSLPTKVVRESVTRDPAFMIANLLRDTVSSWITSGEDITPFLGTAKGFADSLKQGASFKALMGRGVVGSYDLAMKDPSELAAIIKRRLEPKNVHTIASPQGATKVLHMLWDRLGVVSEASDAATRVAVYEAAKAQGLSEAEATFRAIQIMDFSRRGASTSLALLTKLIPFLNARIQGLDVLYQAGMAGGRVLMGKARGERDMNLGKKFLVRGAMLAAISLALEMLNDGDKDYEDLPDYLKKGNLLIPLKELGLEGQFISIPKPFEAGLLFSTLPQMFYKTMAGESSTRQNISFFAESFASTFGVNPIPQILLPALEVMVNHDFYTGLPLISEGKARLSPELQYDSRTSTLSRVIGGIPIKYNFTTGQFEGISPIVLDKLIGGYAGPFGTLIASGVGMAMEGVDVGPERLPRNFTELPLIKRFFIDAESRNPKSVAEAYELFRIVDEANRSFSRLRQTGDVEAVMDYLEKHKTVLSYKKYIYKLVDGLNKLSAYERQIERDKTMTDDQKLEAMKNLRDVRGRLTSQIGEINKALGR